jgi:hypothetical protein
MNLMKHDKQLMQHHELTKAKCIIHKKKAKSILQVPKKCILQVDKKATKHALQTTNVMYPITYPTLRCQLT